MSEKEYVLKGSWKGAGYFRRGGNLAFPPMGAALKDAERYPSQRSAEDARSRMPFVAGVSVDVRAVKAKGRSS